MLTRPRKAGNDENEAGYQPGFGAPISRDRRRRDGGGLIGKFRQSGHGRTSAVPPNHIGDVHSSLAQL